MDESTENISPETENTEQEEQNQEEAVIFEYFGPGGDSGKTTYTKTLLMLHELTKIDGELSEIDEEKGDLPGKIESLKEKLDVLENHLNEDKQKLKNFEAEEKALAKENKSLEEKISKYDESKYKVKSNKEYDDINRQIDIMYETVQKNETRVKELKGYQESLVKGILEMTRTFEENKNELKDDSAHLNALNKQFEDEETELMEKRKDILKKLDENIRNLYERINGSMRGHATAILRKGNCSGCYNSIPPQREIEIRMAENIFSCQSCGRIMIDESLIQNL
jgi:uncharacterized protein